MKETRKKLLIIASLVILLLAWAGSAPPLAAQEIEVTSADPPEAEQGTVNLDVTIKGKGFDRSAKAKFFLTGTTNPGGVTVNSTRFVSTTELVANIDVAVDAVVGNFDIEVQARKGRTGKGTELFSVLEGSGLPHDTLARATFRDFAVDRIQSDDEVLPLSCAADYADFDDPCQPGHPGVSRILNTGDYFLRTLHNHVPNPTRWLVLDFSEGLDGSSQCLNLDQQLADDPERNPDAFVPVDPDPCIDFLEVRFGAGGVFTPNAEYSGVSLVIDKPVWKQGRGKNKEGYNQWDGEWYLDLVNPLTITRDAADPNTVILTTINGLEQAELWTIHEKTGKHDTLLGTYRMPFEVTITRIPYED